MSALRDSVDRTAYYVSKLVDHSVQIIGERCLQRVVLGLALMRR
jgi:hypothetical protein